MKIRSIFTLLILTLLVSYSRAQDIAIKTNLLYGGYTYTPNLSLEIGLGKRSTLDLGGGYNPWNLDGTAENNKKLVHWLGEIEYRYWLCQRFSGHFLGVHVLGSKGNTVIVIEHNLDVIKMADYIIDMGPEGGKGGGELLSCGTPEEVAKSKKGYTPKFLREELNIK